MADRFDFWIHGVNVQVEYTDPGRAVYVRRAGFGTVIRQKGGTGNWFHFAIPTPTYLDDDKVDYQHAYLRGWINGKATVKHVHIWHGRDRIFTQNVSLSARDLNESFNIPDQRCVLPIVICVFVEFETDGEIRFDGAGVRFKEWT